MTHRETNVPPLLPNATESEIRAILGAMRAVAESTGSATDFDQRAVASAGIFLFGMRPPLSWSDVAPIGEPALAAALARADLRREAVKFLAVMAFVDGVLDKNKITHVLRYAQSLGVHEQYIDEITLAAQGRLAEAMADMTRLNVLSISGKPFAGGDIGAWLLPYHGAGADPALQARFEALRHLPAETFGHAFWQHFTAKAYAFPGDPRALNAAFAVPHDSVHVLTGYDTDARGEILTSTFTAAMHQVYPMAGHVLPAIMSWHLKLAFNDVAGAAHDALDPDEFWRAWAAGAAAGFDTFAPDWDFWRCTSSPLAALRRAMGLPEEGLAPLR